MHHRGWIVRRTGVRGGLLVALTAIGFTVTVLIAGILGLTERDTDAAVRTYLSQADGPARVVQLATGLAADHDGQQQAMQRVADDVFGDLPVHGIRRLTSGHFRVAAGTAGTAGIGDADGQGQPDDGAVRGLRLGTYSGFADHVRITDGSWPATADGDAIAVAVPAATAQRWQLRVGDRITVSATLGSDRELSVAAIFAPDDSQIWIADQLPLTGRAVADRSPVFVADPQAVTDAGSTLTVVWTFVPDVDAMTPSDVGTLADALEALPAAVSDGGIGDNGVIYGGSLARSLTVLQAALDAALVAQPLPILLIAAFGLVMVLQLGRLITADRRSETALLKSRGLSAGRLARWAAVEGAIFVLPGALLGLLTAALFSGVTGAGWWVAAAVVVVGVAAAAGPAWRDGAARLLRDRIDDSGRTGNSVAGWGATVLLIVATVFAIWRFRRGGGDAVAEGAGGAGDQVIDPSVLLAPPLTLVCAMVIGMVLFGVGTTVAQRWAARRSVGPSLVMPARQVARRRTVFGATVLMVGLAVGGSAVAAGYAATTDHHRRSTENLVNAADVRVVLPGGDLSATSSGGDPAGPFRDLPATTAEGAVLQVNGQAGDADVAIVGVATDTLGALVREGPLFDPARVAADLGDNPVGTPLPDGTTGLRATVTVSAGGDPGRNSALTVVGWLLGTDGSLMPAPIGSIGLKPDAGTEATVDAEPDLPPGARLAAVDVVLPGSDAPVGYDVRVRMAAVTGQGVTPIDTTSWRPADTSDRPPATESTGESAFHAEQQATLRATVRLMPAEQPPLPLFADAEATRAMNLSPGDRISPQLPGRKLTGEVVGTIDAVPGFPEGGVLLTDLSALQTTLLRGASVIPSITEIWLSSSDPSATIDAARSAVGPAGLVSERGGDSVQALTRPAIQAMWWGAAGALLLGALSMMLVIATLGRSRRAELVVLRAIGMPSAMQAAMRRRELLGTVLCSWLLGLAAGVGTAALVVPGLAQQAVVGGGRHAPGLGFAWQGWALVLAGHVLLVLLAIGWHGLSIRRSARIADPRGVG